MSLPHMAWRYVWSRRAVTLVTLAGIALGVALITSVLTLRREARRTFVEEGTVFDLVVGAKGSPLQLVLSSLYHLDVPTGNIPYSRYEALKADRKVQTAIPIGLGDNYAGFRIVGTIPECFAVERRDLDSGRSLRIFELAEGTLFAHDFEAVLGSDAARRTGLRPGDTFSGSHGLVSAPGSEEHDEHPYKVVGILAPTGTANDRAIFTTLGSIWAIHDSEEEIHRGPLFGSAAAESESEPAEDAGSGFLFGGSAKRRPTRETTAVLLQLRTPGMRLFMADDIRRNTESMAAIPINEMLRLYEQILLPMQRTLLAVAWLVVVVASLTILATLIQAAERRRRDLAILRTLGAHPREIFALVLIEAVFLTMLGIATGAILAHGGVAIAAGAIRETTGLAVNGWSIDKAELQALAAVALTGLIAGLIPASLAYRREPTDDLSAV